MWFHSLFQRDYDIPAAQQGKELHHFSMMRLDKGKTASDAMAL